MSTRATIACKHKDGPYGYSYHLFEEMIGETVHVSIEGDKAIFYATQDAIEVILPPVVIDAIREAPDSAFPHLRNKND